MFPLCDCPAALTTYCSKYELKVTAREHQFLRGTSGLPRAKEEAHIARMLGVDLPGAMKMGWEALKAGLKHLAGGMKEVSEETYRTRLGVCMSPCEQWNRDETEPRCLACGCFLKEKAKWASEDCPLKKWPPLHAHVPTGGSCCGNARKSRETSAGEAGGSPAETPSPPGR
jgi:hypothetical protein